MNCVIVFILWMVVTAAVHLRYRIRVKGLDEVVARYGRKGILFLPNHPALIDPVILNTVLWGRFKPRSLVTEKQIRTTILKRIGWHCPRDRWSRWIGNGRVCTMPEPDSYNLSEDTSQVPDDVCCRPACIPGAHRRRSTSSRGLA